MRDLQGQCPRCHAPAPTEPVSATRFRAWLLCLSCGHVWTASRIALAFRSHIRRHPRPEPPADAETVALTGADVPPSAVEREPDPALESWLGEMEPAGSAGRTWSSVDAWLESDPLPVAGAVRDPAVEEEWGLSRRTEPAPPAHATLLERLDALYQGMVQLERFVAKSALIDEMFAAPKTPAAPRAAVPRPRPRLVPRPEGKPHAPAAA